MLNSSAKAEIFSPASSLTKLISAMPAQKLANPSSLPTLTALISRLELHLIYLLLNTVNIYLSHHI